MTLSTDPASRAAGCGLMSPRLPRPEVTPLTLNLVVSAWLLASCNATFWGKLIEIFGARPVAAATFAVAFAAFLFLVVSLLAVGRAQKPVLAFLVVLAAVTSYYQDKLGVLIDRDMIQNALTTTATESKHLITPRFLGHVALRALPGLALVVWLRVRRRGTLRWALGWLLSGVAAATLTVGLLFTDLKGFSTSLRGRKDLMGSAQPLAPLGGALRYAKMMLKSADVVAAPFGRDAKKGPLLAAADKPVLFVIVAGETARAQNWSLGGYGRETNPELARRDITWFGNATSCGTATATSLPCMFSHLTRDEYSYEGGLSYENVLDVFTHAGVKVEWWDNNTGDKGMAARIPMRFMTREDNPAACEATGECTDEVFLPLLAERAATITEDTVIVLHQIGSHGPSYWLRYPSEAAHFTPDCRSPELADCTGDEIVNAYDNTIRMTDRFLAEVIDLLEAQDRVIPAMLYVSDHGESLGEAGIYLHGTPWFMAPEEQTRVPMVVWTSARWEAALQSGGDCLQDRATEAVSHDNLFSTVLGMMDIVTEVRDPALDLAAGCRTPGG